MDARTRHAVRSLWIIVTPREQSRESGHHSTPTTGTGSARTPPQSLEGTITPNGLYFEQAHESISYTDLDLHQFVIHGLVERALSCKIEALSRYPMVSRVAFTECCSHGALLYQKTPALLPLQGLHGLLSCAELTGVPLSILLDEARRRSERAMGSRGRRRRGEHEPQRSAGEGDG
jgi:DMSO/TMAO reductase YedYZ molybdopterin-dependent catalytic subunit